MRKLALATALALPLVGALAFTSVAQDSKPVDKKDPTPCALAHANGGTVDILCGDDAALREYQGLDGKSEAKVALKWPAEDEVVSQKDAEKVVEYELTGYEIGKDDKGKFQHCHLILDNKPYVPDYDHKTTLQKLAGASPIAEGWHLLTIFPARNFHLSVKNAGACAQVRFLVANTKPAELPTKEGIVPGPKDEQLIYSRPKGEYDASKKEADTLLIDFYLLNVPMDEYGRLKGRIVHYAIHDADGRQVRTKFLGTWWPAFEKLSPPFAAKYKVTVELMSSDTNAVVAGPFNKTEREITIKQDDKKGGSPPNPQPPTPPPPPPSKGGGCALADAGGSAAAFWPLLALGLALARRRSRSLPR
ncbi:hypothetical protein HY251_17770 [bacterium]|nr:hypothetical protein [bacterium]